MASDTMAGVLLRYLCAPWPVRWAWNLFFPAVLLVADLASAAIVRHPAPGALAWAGGAAVVSAVVIAALLTVLADSRLAPQRVLLAGLSASQRSQVAAAAKYGPLPDDPEVIVASVTYMSPRATQSGVRQWMLVVIALLGILYAGYLMRDPLMRGSPSCS